MKHLVVFGCGYLGLALVQRALTDGWQVTALTRNPEAARAAEAAGATVVRGALEADDWHVEILPQAEAVVCCVGAADRTPAGYERSYLDGQASIRRWAAQGHVGHYLYTSSTRVYPQTDGGLVTEADAAAPEALDAGGRIVRLSEELALRPAPGIAGATVLRLAGIYGPGRHHLLDALRAGKTRFPGAGDHWLNLIHRDDVVAALLAAIAQPSPVVGRIFNLADSHPLRKKDLLAWLAAQLGLADVTFDPSLSDLRARRRGDRPWPHRVVSNTALREALCWEPVFPQAQAGYRPILTSPDNP